MTEFVPSTAWRNAAEAGFFHPGHRPPIVADIHAAADAAVRVVLEALVERDADAHDFGIPFLTAEGSVWAHRQLALLKQSEIGQ